MNFIYISCFVWIFAPKFRNSGLWFWRENSKIEKLANNMISIFTQNIKKISSILARKFKHVYFYWDFSEQFSTLVSKVDTFVDNHLPNGLNRHDHQQKDETSWLARLKPPKKELKNCTWLLITYSMQEDMHLFRFTK